jgi:hypothetical protein
VLSSEAAESLLFRFLGASSKCSDFCSRCTRVISGCILSLYFGLSLLEADARRDILYMLAGHGVIQRTKRFALGIFTLVPVPVDLGT